MISINHLHKEILERQSKRNTIYEEVFLKIIAKIKYANSRTSDCQCLYAVPAFMYGTPLYDLKNCLLYVVNRLREHFFYVKYAPPNILYISWAQRPFTGGMQLNPLALTPKNGLTYLADSPIEANNLLEIKSSFHIDPETEKRQMFNAIDREFIESSLTGGAGKRPVVAPYNDFSNSHNRQQSNPSLDNILDQLDINNLDIKGTLL